MTINIIARGAKRIIALIALIAFCAAMLAAQPAQAAAAKRLNLADIAGEYEYLDVYRDGVLYIQFIKDGNKLVEVWPLDDGAPRHAHDKYDPATGVATRVTKEKDYTESETLTFTRSGETIALMIEYTRDYNDSNKPDGYWRYYGFKIPAAKASIPIDQAEGTYEYQRSDSNTVHQVEMVRSGDELIARLEDGSEKRLSYYPDRAVASRSNKAKNGSAVHTVWSFSKNDGVIEAFILESDITKNASQKLYTYKGQRINLVGSGGPAAEFSTEALPKLADFQWYINDIQKTGSPQHLKGVKFIKDFELVKGGWKGIIFDNEANLAKSGCLSTFNLDISGSAKSVKLTPDWYREYDSFNEKDVRGDATGTDPFAGTWGSGRDYGFVKAEDEFGDNKINIGMFYELNGKQYALGILTWWDGWENYVALVRP